MFLDFYQMREQPFGVTPDSRFLYLGPSHREALASLFYSIEADRGFAALIAPPGMGKTTLTFQLLEKLQKTSRTVFLFPTQCDSRHLFQCLLTELGIDANAMDVVSMHRELSGILNREMLAGRRVVLAIDEAQNLDPEALETIRMLSNFETSRAKLIQILLIGQPQLARKLSNPALEQLQQRISVFAQLEPFGSEDVYRYIAHRLQTAGYEGDPLFTREALRLIADQSQGIPRKINGLCFGGLSLGYAMKRKQIDARMLGEVIRDLDMEVLHSRCVAPRVMTRYLPLSRMLSYCGAEPKRRIGQWTLAAACIVASIVVGFAIHPYSFGRIGRFLQTSTETWVSIRNATASSAISTKLKPSIPPGLSEQGTEIPSTQPGVVSSVAAGAETDAVIVQPGDALSQIILRTMGAYDIDTIDQIRKLNPAINNLDHLEVGQTIQVPRITRLETFPAPSGLVGTNGKDKGLIPRI